jgi:hypothetical protein
VGQYVPEPAFTVPVEVIMKATLKGKIISMNKVSGDAVIGLDAAGKVLTNKISAQDISFKGSFQLKGIIADEMKIGAIITVTLSDEET